MSNKLKIYACSGIGDLHESKSVAYWLDDTETVSNTQAVNTLLAKINLAWMQATQIKGIAKEEKIALLNEIDWMSVALDAAKRFAGKDDALYHAGEVISVMVADGAFDYNSIDNREREDHLEDLIEKANSMYGDEDIKGVDPEFMAWWSKTIVSRNKVGLDSAQQTESKKILKKAAKQIKGIGAADEAWKEDGDIAQYLTQAGLYFLYLYFTNEQLAKLPGVFRLKRKKQEQIYNYCKTYFVDVYGSEEDMQDIIRTGIIKDCKGEPEAVCEDIASKGVKGVGVSEFLLWLGVKGLIALIAVIGSAIIGIVAAVCDSVYKSNVQKYASMEKAVIDAGCPEDTDYDGLNLEGGTAMTSGKKSWITWAAIGAGLLLLLKR